MWVLKNLLRTYAHTYIRTYIRSDSYSEVALAKKCISAKFQLSSWSRSGWKVCGGVGWVTSRQNRGKVSFCAFSYPRITFSMSRPIYMAWSFDLTFTGFDLALTWFWLDFDSTLTRLWLGFDSALTRLYLNLDLYPNLHKVEREAKNVQILDLCQNLHKNEKASKYFQILDLCPNLHKIKNNEVLSKTWIYVQIYIELKKWKVSSNLGFMSKST